MVKLSYNTAIRIQTAQMYWYMARLKRTGVRVLRDRTLPCPPDIHPDDPISVLLINMLVPRGGTIESIADMYGTTHTAHKNENTDVLLAWNEYIKEHGGTCL